MGLSINPDKLIMRLPIFIQWDSQWDSNHMIFNRILMTLSIGLPLLMAFSHNENFATKLFHKLLVRLSLIIQWTLQYDSSNRTLIDKPLLMIFSIGLSLNGDSQ
jgi:hypothetical protein